VLHADPRGADREDQGVWGTRGDIGMIALSIGFLIGWVLGVSVGAFITLLLLKVIKVDL